MHIIIEEHVGGSFNFWPDMFAQFEGETFSQADTFALQLSYEAHIIIDINCLYLFQAIHNFLNKHKIPSLN